MTSGGLAPTTRIYLEEGRTWVFAAAIDWPGWCRKAKGEEAAVDLLAEYAPRYASVAGPGFNPGELEVISRIQGTATTDFGAPDARGPWDEEPLGSGEAGRLVSILEACWGYFDAVVASSPQQLRKGPKGGGRDRDEIVAHVREAERAFSARTGTRIPPRTSWKDQRAALANALRAGASTPKWPSRYAVRRCAWHVLDHAWEIEDKRS
ncbi:MAG TPA: hypothetical protein VED59_07840 [Acidimicrobiales bacterium]|nr:hypothetical protein [Acidimicrobiales bacterium]